MHAAYETGLDTARARRAAKKALFGFDSEPVRIGRYTVTGRLGTGGMGVVYSARDEDLDRDVAVKVIRRDRLERDAPAEQVRLAEEAKALAALSHPNVVEVFDIGSFEDGLYVAMELVRGRSLAQWLSDNPGGALAPGPRDADRCRPRDRGSPRRGHGPP